MFLYEKNYRYFATVPDELEEPACEEFKSLGAAKIEPVKRGLYFYADKPALYRINYCSRLAVKILAPLGEFDCEDDTQLYNCARKLIAWTKLFNIRQTFAIDANVWDSGITHSKYAALKLKDAIADTFTSRFGKRPDVDTENPDIRFNLHLNKNLATVSLETSGGSLHKRGYRKETVKAPIQEILAGAMIKMAEWDGQTKLLDPMCGCGTIVCEALMSYCRIPAGYLRKKFGFEHLTDFDAAVWRKVKMQMDSHIRELPEGLIFASDSDPRAVRFTQTNLANLPYGDRVTVRQMKFQGIAKWENAVIITNPPYGLRMTGDEGTEQLYKELGDFLKQRCNGTSAYIYCGNREMIKHIHLRTKFKKVLKSGGLDGRFIRIDLF